MREVVGFAAGVTVTAAASVLLRSEAGRRLVRDLVSEAEPELNVAAEEWRPLLREVARAVKLGAREVAGAVEILEGHLARLADEAEARAAKVDTDQPPDPMDPDPASASADPTAALAPAREP
jgi:hypothetical protein